MNERNNELSKRYRGGGETKYHLNDEQKKIAEENHKLIYSFLNRYHLNIDEYYDVAAIGYCKAIASYDESKGIKLSAYCYHIMLNEVKMEKRKYFSSSRIPYNLLNSLEYEIYNNEGDSFSIEDIVSSNEDHTIDVQYNILINEYFNKVSERDRNIIIEALSGAKQEVIAKDFGLSRSYISRIYNRFKNYIKEIKKDDEK